MTERETATKKKAEWQIEGEEEQEKKYREI